MKWHFIRPLIVVAVILGLAFLLSRSCVDGTGTAYYHNHYPGFIYLGHGRGYYYPRARGVRGGK